MRSLAFLVLILLGTGCATSHVKKNQFSGILDVKNSRTYSAKEDEEPAVAPEEVREIRQKTSAWRWPLTSVQITSPFGHRSGNAHEGVDLKAQSGTPVYAASSGKVLYAGSKLAGYGQLIVLKHPDGLSTIYAHNSNLMVRAGQNVHQGQQISLSGNTGRTTGPHLHFEIRRGVRAIDPTDLIAQSQVARPAESRRVLAAAPRVIPRTVRSTPRTVSRVAFKYSRASARRKIVHVKKKAHIKTRLKRKHQLAVAKVRSSRKAHSSID